VLAEVPSVQFLVNRYTNLFYHVCVLFFEYFPDEYSLGILNNSAYRKQHEHLKTESIHKKFQKLCGYSYYAWDFVGKSLFGTDTWSSADAVLERESQEQAEVWLEILSEASTSYENTWAQTEAKLKEYRSTFETEWNPVYKSILTRMSSFTKLPWPTKAVNVHLVDCVYGAQSWVGDVVAPPWPVVDIEKKLLAHEIAHILVPDYFLKPKLQSLGLDCAISHTIVDLIAYFGVKEYVTDLERRGMKPNPNYYAQAIELFPIFEDCYTNADQYHSFDEILMQIELCKSNLNRK
jgi:hypothetical protein